MTNNWRLFLQLMSPSSGWCCLLSFFFFMCTNDFLYMCTVVFVSRDKIAKCWPLWTIASFKLSRYHNAKAMLIWWWWRMLPFIGIPQSNDGSIACFLKHFTTFILWNWFIFSWKHDGSSSYTVIYSDEALTHRNHSSGSRLAAHSPWKLVLDNYLQWVSNFLQVRQA